MSRRVPSTSSALTSSSQSTIRHRSGAFNPRPPPEEIDAHHRRHVSLNAHILRTDHTLPVQDEDLDDASCSPPSVLLARRSRVSARRRDRFKPLPGLPFQGGPDTHAHTADLREGLSHLLDTDPLPQEDGVAQGSSSIHGAVPLPERNESYASVHTSGASSAASSRLPTPNYDAGPGTGAAPIRGLSSYFSRMPSLRARPSAAPRTESEVSTYSHLSDESTAISHPPSRSGSSHTHIWAKVPTAIKDKRPLLGPTLSTTDKFTQKFPRPRAMRGMSVSGGGSASVLLLEEGEGLGFERVGKWTLHKWCLVLSVCTVFVYGCVGLVCAILTWFRAWEGADVMYVADYDILVLLTLASCILLLTALVGLSGTLLNSRPLLAVYALLLWPALAALLAVGYPSYKRYAFALDRKLSRAWSEWYTPLGRRVIQDALACCGFLTPLHAAAPSTRCYPRSALPGCKGALWRFERAGLATVWGAVFALVPVHIVNIFVALLCANHVTKRFGKGITPKRYRLSGEDVRADAEVLVKALGGVRRVARPGLSRAPTSVVFREDRTYDHRRGYV